VLSGGELTGAQLGDLLVNLPCKFSAAAAGLHAPASTAPLPAKLASCRLLALLMPTQHLADTALCSLQGLTTGFCANVA